LPFHWTAGESNPAWEVRKVGRLNLPTSRPKGIRHFGNHVIWDHPTASDAPRLWQYPKLEQAGYSPALDRKEVRNFTEA
jgi:hypothetical protein